LAKKQASLDITPETPSATSNRRFKRHNSVMHDLYKLEAAPMLKNMAMDPPSSDVQIAPEFIRLEHCHIYHTVDSKGQPQSNCSPIGGHFHVIEVVTPGDGDNPPVLRCSGPKKMARHPVTKKAIMVPYEREHFDANGNPYTDDHTHKITYISSEEFKPRKVNMEAQKVIAQLGQAPAAVPGVIG